MSTHYDPNTLYIDVRSEGEYQKGHIPGSINYPILNDQERHEVGYTYKNISIDDAKRLGLSFAGKKVVGYFDLIQSLQTKHPNTRIIFYCSRGGFRSRSITNLLKSIGVEVDRLEGGYKAYRQLVTHYFEQASFPDFIMLHGLTGVGKTDHLKQLAAAGYAVLDLEGIACHKGSHLGSIGIDKKQSAQNFENLIYETLTARPHETFFVESESKRIGTVFIPNPLFEAIKSGQHILIELPLSLRIQRLIEEYAGANDFDEKILPALDNIKRYISHELYQNLLTDLQDKHYDQFCEKILSAHYDPVYEKSMAKYDYDLHCHASTLEENALLISQWLQSNNR